MSEPLLESLLALLTTVFGYEVGTNEFKVVFGASVCALLLAARIMAGMLGSKSGILRTSLGMILPLAIGGVAYATVEVQVLPSLNRDAASLYLPWVGFGLLLLGSVYVLTRRFLDTGFLLAAFIYVLSVAASVGGSIGADALIDFMNSSRSQIENHESRVNQEAELSR